MDKKQVLLVFVMWILNACANDIHKHMTPEELRHTFHVDHHHLVPEYEIVHIHRIKKRSIGNNNNNDNNIQKDVVPKDDATNYKHRKTKLQFNDDVGDDYSNNINNNNNNLENLKLNAFGKSFNLSLIKNDGLFKKSGLKIWTVEPNATAQHGVEYVEIPHTDEEVGEIYQDENNEAAILLRTDENGTMIVEGSVGSDLIIRPIPWRLREKLKIDNVQSSSHDDDEMFLDDDGELSAEVAIDTGLPIKRKESQKHIVYKRKQTTTDDTFSDYAFMEPDHLSKRYKRSVENKNNNKRSKREAPYTIYPEILVIVDYDGYRLHAGDNLQIKRYFVSFWNGVDMRYKLLKGPKIRISIAGIIISRGRDATPYLERNRVGRDAIDSAAALTDMGKYLFKERRLPVYDIAVAITKYDMCRRRKGGRCTKGTAGFAYVGGACVVNKRLEKVNSVAIIEDTGGFSGIIVAAHEVGHLLGAVHDGSAPPSYLGGPGAEKCEWTDGYIMSDLRHTERGFRWSSCSVASFHHFLNGDTATCLYNAPHEDKSLPRVLPGKLLSLDAQCRRDRGTSACFKDDRVCAQLFCFDSSSGYCIAYRPAAEGSYCGDGQYCLNGRCVAEHENIIPDYSQNTPSYLRRDGNGNQGRPLFHEDEGVDIINGDQYTTQPYYNYQRTDNYNNNNNHNTQQRQQQQQYVNTKPPQLYTFQQLSTTKPPFNINNNNNNNNNNIRNIGTQFAITTKNPFINNNNNYNNYFFAPPTTTPSPPIYPPPQSTLNPYIGNYYFLKQQTTINPYNFANFGNFGKNRNPESIDEINNNHLKRSYIASSYFVDSTNIRNVSTTINNQTMQTIK